MNDAKNSAIALNIRLQPVEHSDQPHMANYPNVGVAQGIAYIDFGFVEPVLLGAIVKTAKDGQAPPKLRPS